MGEGGEGSAKEVMDTPERSKNNQIAASLSRFEDSPVFNFLNSLSPIQPIKSTYITQPINFGSLPSVFTSPHVTSLKESRFLQRLSDPSKPEFSSIDATQVVTNTSTTDAVKQLEENAAPDDDDEAAETSYDCSKFVDFHEDYDGTSPKANVTTDYACSSSALIVQQDDSQSCSFRSKVNVEGVNELNQNDECSSCDWNNLIDASDLQLIFESPDCSDPFKKSIHLEMSSYTNIGNDVGPSEVAMEGNDPENACTQPGEGNECDTIAGSSMNNADDKVDFENLGFYRGMRRRCLDFEMRKHLDEKKSSDSVCAQPIGSTSSNDQTSVLVRTGNEPSRRLLPGIGLHLNALATTPKDYKIINHDSSMSGRLLIGPSSAVSFRPSSAGQELIPLAPSEREIDNMERAIVPVEDGSRYAGNEENNQNSPKKKRRKAEQGGEGESCKRCNCKRSKCLKLYCECFAAGVYCVEPCACIDCFNKPIHEDTVLATRKQIESRNPLAFAPKVIRGSDSPSETRDDSSKTPASARHKRGCNCKKSGCLKKYCECYQGGVGCSINCRCEGCKNAFGRKDGLEGEVEEEEIDGNEKVKAERSFKKTTVENELEQITDSAPPATPLRGGRQPAQPSFSSKKKPPRSSLLSNASSSGFHAKTAFGNTSFFPPPPKFDKQFETIKEGEMPDFLQGGSPVDPIKVSSPNRKRVSPPHNAGMSPPGLRSSRKLVLESIRAFPNLSQNQ